MCCVPTIAEHSTNPADNTQFYSSPSAIQDLTARGAMPSLLFSMSSVFLGHLIFHLPPHSLCKSLCLFLSPWGCSFHILSVALYPQVDVSSLPCLSVSIFLYLFLASFLSFPLALWPPFSPSVLFLPLPSSSIFRNTPSFYPLLSIPAVRPVSAVCPVSYVCASLSLPSSLFSL